MQVFGEAELHVAQFVPHGEQIAGVTVLTATVVEGQGLTQVF